MRVYQKCISAAILLIVLFTPFIQKIIKSFFKLFGNLGTALYWGAFAIGCAAAVLLIFDLATYFLRNFKDNYRNIKK